MANAWEFPTSIDVDGVQYEIRTDYRVVLDLMTALNDPELLEEDEETRAYIQGIITLQIMFPDCDNIPEEHIKDALKKVVEFIDMGMESDSKNAPKTMDWEQDAPILIPAINKVLNCEIRAQKYIHWWTFLGAYMEIGESLFSSIVNIRQKLAKPGKKLEKWEQDFYKENKSLIDFKQKNQRSDGEKNMLRDYFGYGKK